MPPPHIKIHERRQRTSWVGDASSFSRTPQRSLVEHTILRSHHAIIGMAVIFLLNSNIYLHKI